MSEALLWLFLFGLVAVIVAVFYFQTRTHKQRLHEHLLSKGARDITVTWIWLTPERDGVTYDIVYTDRLGNRRKTRCKIHRDGWYWREPPEE